MFNSCLDFVTCFFIFFIFGYVLFSKTESFSLVWSFDFFVFHSFVVRLESGLEKNNLIWV